ncbi:MAG TPA: hypothetical protein VJ023_12510 [Pyrinomonadaceae bacterium]|nr:hypothetical protein [Pyrinomonadaceae bacterium]
MITGFNTNVEHDGVVYHVQTEDKGLNSPLILSLVYSGGAILASKRTPYEDLIASGFDEAVLSERLKRQHKLICAAIRAGRVEELKKMTARDQKGATPEVSSAEPPPSQEVEIVTTPRDSSPVDADLIIVRNAQEETTTPSVEEAAPSTETPSLPSEQFIIEHSLEPTTVIVEEPQAPPHDESAIPDVVASEEEEPVTKGETKPPIITPSTKSRRTKPQVQTEPYVVFDSRREGEPRIRQGLNVNIINDQEFRSGEKLKLGVLVTHRTGRKQKPLPGVSVSVKILGTTFRPVIISKKTGTDGVAVVLTEIPRFSTGRAAILVRAADGADSVEIRRVVRPEGK